MPLPSEFRAPWCTTLKAVTFTGIAIALALTIAAFVGRPALPWAAPLLSAILLACSLSTIRRYSITKDAIIIHRLLWNVRLPTTGLTAASADPRAMRGSLRTFGIGGCFSWSGWYWNRSLRSYRAFVTDPHCAVILRWNKRTAVLSPDDPARFIASLQPLAS
jgi:hypothetical protein